jgi:hypothetical protein
MSSSAVGLKGSVIGSRTGRLSPVKSSPLSSPLVTSTGMRLGRGVVEGSAVGGTLGSPVGSMEGVTEGSPVGSRLGMTVGTADGDWVRPQEAESLSHGKKTSIWTLVNVMDDPLAFDMVNVVSSRQDSIGPLAPLVPISCAVKNSKSSPPWQTPAPET